MSINTAFFRLYLLAILAFGVHGASIGAAKAQSTDLNLESRFEPFVPRVSKTTSPPETERVVVRKPAVVREKVEDVPLTDEQRMNMAAQKRGLTAETLRAQSPEEIEKILESIPKTRPVVTRTIVRPARTVVETKPKPRSIEFYWIGSAGYSYESNANNSRTNGIGDSVTALTAAVRTKIPVGDQSDTINVVVSSTSARYSKLTSQDADLLVGSAVYGHLLASMPGSSKTKSSNTAINDIFNFSVEGKSIHAREYGTLLGNYLTPSAGLSRNNIPLLDALCGKPGKESFCYAANLGGAVRYVAANVTSRQYVAAKISGEINVLTEVEGLAFNTGGSIDYKYFTDFPGGRQDTIFGVGAGLQWDVNEVLTLSAGVSFTYQTSTVAAAEWNGFSMGPKGKLVIQFN